MDGSQRPDEVDPSEVNFGALIDTTPSATLEVDVSLRVGPERESRSEEIRSVEQGFSDIFEELG